MANAYDLVHCPQFPLLKVIKTHNGNIFVGAKSAVQVLSGQSEDSAGVKLSMYIKLHYPTHVFVDVTDPKANNEHVCWYKVQSGQNSYAFSVAGLEHLCKNLPGFVAFQKRTAFLELIEDFKNSLSHKRPHSSSGEGLPNPKRAANDLVDQPTTGGDASMLPVAVVKQALIAHTAMISDEVVKAVEPFHQAMVSSQLRMNQGNQELREEVGKIEMKAETLMEKTSTIERGYLTETIANREKISRQEYMLARLNQSNREKEAIIQEKDAQIERLNLQLDDDLRTVSDNVVTLKKELGETNAKIDRLQSSFDTINASLKTLIDLLLPGT